MLQQTLRRDEARTRLSAELKHDQRQMAMAREGRARGQCPDPTCQAFTWDGEPPRWHTRTCKISPRG